MIFAIRVILLVKPGVYVHRSGSIIISYFVPVAAVWIFSQVVARAVGTIISRETELSRP